MSLSTLPEIEFEAYGRSVTGMRHSNQDRILSSGILEQVGDGIAGTEGRIWAIADGVTSGGYGAEAAALALSVVREKFRELRSLRSGIQSANSAVRRAQRDEWNGRGYTTLVACASLSNMVQIAWVGDSRAYVYAHGRLDLISRDHVDDSGGVTRLVGLDQDIEPEFVNLELPDGAYVLLATDGLSSIVDDYSIESILASSVNSYTAVESLFAAARASNVDDATAVVLRVERARTDSLLDQRSGLPRGDAATAGLLALEAGHSARTSGETRAESRPKKSRYRRSAIGSTVEKLLGSVAWAHYLRSFLLVSVIALVCGALVGLGYAIGRSTGPSSPAATAPFLSWPPASESDRCDVVVELEGIASGAVVVDEVTARVWVDRLEEMVCGEVDG